MSTQLLPDIEDVLVQYLLDIPLETDDGEVHVYGPELPASPAYPLVQITAISGRPQAHHWLGRALIQVDGWCTSHNDTFDDPRATARQACEAAVAALHDARNVEVGGCVLGSAEDNLAARPQPDPVTSNRRYIAEVVISYHHVPGAS